MFLLLQPIAYVLVVVANLGHIVNRPLVLPIFATFRSSNAP